MMDDEDSPFAPHRVHELCELEAWKLGEVLKEVKKAVLATTTPSELQDAIQKGIVAICDEAEHHEPTTLAGIVQRRDLERRLQGCRTKEEFKTRFQSLAEDLAGEMELAVSESAGDLADYDRFCILLDIPPSPNSPQLDLYPHLKRRRHDDE